MYAVDHLAIPLSLGMRPKSFCTWSCQYEHMTADFELGVADSCLSVQPQRPVRVMRGGDENAPLHSLVPAKTIHQRNKSTPALSTLLQVGGFKTAATKRTVFADVSNTVRAVQPTKDDAILASKNIQTTVKETSVVHTQTQELLKPVGLLRPAQRPLSAVVQKVTVADASNATESAVSKHAISDPDVQTLNARKVITRRATTTFREVLSEEQSTAVSTDTQDHVPVASLDHVLPLLEESSSRTRDELDGEQHVAMKRNAGLDSTSKAHPVPSTETTIPEKVRIVEKVEARQNSFEARPALDVPAEYKVVPVDTQETHEYLQILERQAIALERERNDELARRSAILPIAEAEEYWDEEEEEEYYDADGYTTARSLRSRGDNTTSGMTIVLAPRVTAKVERELAAAKQFVDATKTPEDVEDEAWDTSMVAEYGDEIFQYMRDLEVSGPFAPAW